MSAKMARNSERYAGGCSRNTAIIVALITLLGTIATALIGKLSGIEVSRLGRSACGSDSLGDSQWTVLSGDWIHYGGLVRFSPKKFPSGLLIGGKEFTEGSIETTIRLPGYKNGCKAHVAYSLRASSEDFFTAGLGGLNAAYSMGEYKAGGWHQSFKRGDGGSLSDSQIYKIRLTLTDGRTALEVNDTKIAEAARESGAPPSVVGLWVEGCEAAEFICTKICAE